MPGFPIDAERWEQGLTLEDFLARMTSYAGAMRLRLDLFRMTPYERNLFARLQTPVHILMMTEDWCSDSLMNLPVFAHMARISPVMDLRIFVRTEWPDLRSYYESRGIQAIPVATFLDEDYCEIGTWVERPASAHRFVADWRARHPEYDAIKKRCDLPAEERRTLLQPYINAFVDEMLDQYDQGFQLDTVAEVRAVLKPLLLDD